MAKKQSSKKSSATKPASTPKKQAAGAKRKRNDETPSPSRPSKAVKQEMQDCDICADTKPLYRNFPSLPGCDHEPTVCVDCYKTHFVTKIDADRLQGWEACSCPLCAEPVGQEDAQGILPRALSREINEMIRKAQKATAINWIWCPATGCGHGQLHELTKKPWVQCSKCQTKICYNHQRRWHDGMTCLEFDELANHDEAAKKDMVELKKTTKPCPFCKIRIKKEGGCNHMMCTSCHKHWLWDTIPFEGEHTGSSAEIAGGPEVTNAIGGGERVAVEQVMRFENAQVDNPRRPLPLDVPLADRFPALPGAATWFRGVADMFAGGLREPDLPNPPRVPAQREATLSPEPAGFLQGVANLMRDFRARRTVTVSVVRRTEPQPQPQTEVGHAVQRHVATSPPVSRERHVIDLDLESSDDEDDQIVERLLAEVRAETEERARQNRRRARRARRARRQERAQSIVDLTEDTHEARRDIIDLTMDD